MESIHQSVDIIVQMMDIDPTTTIEMIDWSSHFHQPSRPIYAVPKCHLSKVRDYFVDKDWRLLPTRTNMNVMHLCPRMEYEQQIDEYLTTADNFTIIEQYSNEALFDVVVDRIQHTLMKLQRKRKLSDQHYWTMGYFCQDEKKIFDEIFFVPHLNNPLEPIIIFEKSPTKNIVDYLYNIINERYRLLFRSSTDECNAAIDLIKEFEAYSANGFLKDTTLVACVELQDLDRYLSHGGMIDALQRFLDDYMIDEDTHGLSHSTIICLADMVLRSQFYRHGHRIYRKTRGGCQQVPFFRLLTNIYLVYLQNDLYDIFDAYDEIFYRHNNQIICTWNASKIVLRTLLGLYLDIRCDMPIKITIGTQIQTMNIEIDITNGELITKPYRSSPMEYFRFLYVSCRANRLYRHDLRSKLIRLVQMCSRMEDFDSELTKLREYCLLTGFPVNLIEDSIEDFFLEFPQTTYSTWRASLMNIDANCMSYRFHKRSHDDSIDVSSQKSVKRCRFS